MTKKHTALRARKASTIESLASVGRFFCLQDCSIVAGVKIIFIVTYYPVRKFALGVFLRPSLMKKTPSAACKKGLTRKIKKITIIYALPQRQKFALATSKKANEM